MSHQNRFAMSVAISSILLVLAPMSQAQQEAAAVSAVAPAASRPAARSKEEIAAKVSEIAASRAAARKVAEAAAPPPPKPVEISTKDPAIRAAIKKAQATLDTFLPVAEMGDPNNQAVSLKVAIRDGKKVEHVWVTPFKSLGKSHFSGKVNDKPEIVGNVREGEQWIFSREDIVDWMYYDTAGGKMHGNYSTCAKLTKGPQADRDEMKRMYGLECGK